MSEFEVIVYTGDGKVFFALQSNKFDIEILDNIITVKDKKDKHVLLELHGFPFMIKPEGSENG
ncbi:MAG: hypothetical protein GU362_05995 [Thaumarchaeota archaeon]|jgi:hypothetical protein|nr:hypothetical protein [Nitrososphaerota archaeon]